MRILGLDVGDVTIGIAVSDPLRIIAQPLYSLRRGRAGECLKAIEGLVREYDIEKIVIGLPVTLSGEVGIQAQKVLDFVETLKKSVEVPLVLWDERLTTVEAERILIEADVSRRRRKKLVDKLAAVIMLQGYLDKHL